MSFLPELDNKIYEDCVNSVPSLDGKTAAITGCTTGTGFHAAKAAISKNIRLLLLLNRESSRSEKCEESLKEYAKEVGSETKIQTIACDLMDFAAVREAAANVVATAKEYGGLDALINNAGIMAFPDNRTKDGFDVQMQTNHLSHFLLTKLVLPSLEEAAETRGEARIVQHSSDARNVTGEPLKAKYFQRSAKGELGGDASTECFQRYHQTKLANTVFAMVLHEKLLEKGMDKIKSVVAEPGIAQTALTENLGSSHAEAEGFSMLGVANTVLNVAAPVLKLMAPIAKAAVSRIMQSGPDGACPLIVASFSKEAMSGDFFIPEHKMVGKPMKRISAGQPTTPGREKLTLDKESHAMLWEVSQESIGESFF